LITKIFLYFYFAINVGSVLSTLITPLIRTNVSYAAAFGLPSVLLAIATLVFVSGRRRYRRLPPSGSIVSRVFAALALALYRAARALRCGADARDVGTVHWLDRVKDKYGAAIGNNLLFDDHRCCCCCSQSRYC
jgi:solute carrier family 15 oligopeptide transporter 1